MPPPRFCFGDPHYSGPVPEAVEGCDCSRCDYLREFERQYEEDLREDEDEEHSAKQRG